jgi:hypothetical protein
LLLLVLLAQDDGFVDECVVIVLVVGHEAVADRQQEVVADRQESFEASELWSLDFVDAGRCGRWLLRTLVVLNAGRCGRWSL